VITVLLLGTTTAKYSQTFNDVVQHGICWWFSSFSLFSFLVEVVGYIIKELHLRLSYYDTTSPYMIISPMLVCCQLHKIHFIVPIVT
jgi:hypothetical protein